MMRKFAFLILLMGIIFPIFPQSGILDQLLEVDPKVPQKISGTFSGTRLINGHSVETRSKGVLDFLISHRFGRINGGAYQFFGLDQSNIRLGLEYGVLDRLNFGIGRNSFQKVFDGFVKYKILWQKDEGGNSPLSLTFFSNLAINSLRNPNVETKFQDRLAFTNQLLIARKFNTRLSMQLTPTFIRRNKIPIEGRSDNLIALGLGGRYRITPRTSVNLEYFYRHADADFDEFQNALAIGVDIETGGHVFQLHLTNAQAITETMFIPETTGNFFDGDIHFGFNVSRSFQLNSTSKK